MTRSRSFELATAIQLAIATTVLCAGLAAPGVAAAEDAPAPAPVAQTDDSSLSSSDDPLLVAQAGGDQAAEDDDPMIEEVVVTGSQIRGAGVNDALAVSVIDSEAISDFGFESGDELLDAIPEQGQNFFNEAENISGGVNSVGGDIGAFNLRNIGTGNTLVLLNGRRVVNSATFQTEEILTFFIDERIFS